MNKLRIFINYDKEEKWLEKMLARGYQFQGRGLPFRYRFHKTEPRESVIRIDYRIFKRYQDFVDYCTLFQDSGWAHIAGTQSSGAQYFIKMTDSSSESIFSDPDSQAVRYKKVFTIGLSVSIIYFLFFLLFIDKMRPDYLLNPQIWYFTPGLWDMEGLRFWVAFLIETPLALGRGSAVPVFFFVIFLISIISTLKTWRLYKLTLSERINESGISKAAK